MEGAKVPLDNADVTEILEGVVNAANDEQPDMLMGRQFTISLMDLIKNWKYTGVSPTTIILSLWVVLHMVIQENNEAMKRGR